MKAVRSSISAKECEEALKIVFAVNEDMMGRKVNKQEDLKICLIKS